MIDRLSDQQWWEYQQLGYLRLGSVLDASDIAALQERIDAIMLGDVHYPSLRYQLDTGGAYEDLPDPDARGAGATLGTGSSRASRPTRSSATSSAARCSAISAAATTEPTPASRFSARC